MSEEGHKSWWIFFRSRWFLLGIFVLTALAIFAFGRAYYQGYQVRQEIARLQEEARRLEGKKIETLELLQYAQTKDFVEEKARTELNMIKPGEKVAVVAKNTGATSSGQENAEVVKSINLSNFKKWWRFFTGQN